MLGLGVPVGIAKIVSVTQGPEKIIEEREVTTRRWINGVEQKPTVKKSERVWWEVVARVDTPDKGFREIRFKCQDEEKASEIVPGCEYEVY